jgi:hypothetical protein
MRKLLMTATAVVGAMGLAVAAHAAPASGMQSGLGGDGTIFGPTTSYPGPTNLPGQIQFYFRGRLHFDMMVGGDSIDHGKGTKSGNIFFGEYARLYSGFEGTAANGLQFGAFLEVRQNGGGLGSSTGGNTLIFRREVGYFKGNWGELRFGQTDSNSGLFQTGNFENFDDGGANGDLPGLFSGNAQVDWPFPENSGMYTTSKVVYLSPSFSGFDFGISYEPNFSGNGDAGGCGTSAIVSGSSCNRASTIPGGGQYRRNTFDLTGRYQGKLGPVGLAVMVGMIHAGHVHNTSAAASDPTTFQGGVVVSLGGLAFGGDVITGNTNGTGYAAVVPLEKGGHHETAFIVGTSYAFGPFIVGASYLDETMQGAYGTGAAGANTTRHQVAIAAGGTYAWAPGVASFVSFIYEHRHQYGYDFNTASTGLDQNNTRAMGMLIGNTFNW